MLVHLVIKNRRDGYVITAGVIKLYILVVYMINNNEVIHACILIARRKRGNSFM